MLLVAGPVLLGLSLWLDSGWWLGWALRVSSTGILPDESRLAVADIPRFLIDAGLTALLVGIFWPPLVRWAVHGRAFLDEAPSGCFLRASLIAAFLFRVVYVLAVDNQPVADWAAYDALARSLIHDGGYLELGQPAAYRPPGYPFFLAFIYLTLGWHPVWAELANAVLGVGSCWLTYLIGREFFSERVARRALLATAFFPTQIYFAGLLASETLFTFLFLLSLWLFARWGVGNRTRTNGVLVAAGFTLGLTALIRPVTLMLPSVLATYSLIEWAAGRLLWARAIRTLAWIAVGMSVALSPWIVRNYVVFQVFIPVSTSGAENFWIGAHPGADGSGRPAFPYEQVVARQEGNPAAGYIEGIAFIREQPGAYLALALTKTRLLMLNGNYGVGWEIGTGLSAPMPELMKILLGRIAHLYYLAVLVLASLSVWFVTPGGPRLHLFYWIIAYWVAFHVLFFGQPAFPLPPGADSGPARYLRVAGNRARNLAFGTIPWVRAPLQG